MFPFLEAFTDMRAGIAIAQGGASRLIDALAAMGAERGMELRTGAEVAALTLENGRATGVELATGERIGARRAVIAGVTPTILYERLLAGAALPAPLRRAAQRYRYGPGTLMVHLALSAPPAWEAGEDLARFAYVHVAPYVEDLAATYAHACAGILPSEPMLVVGQSSAVDPTRCAEGALLCCAADMPFVTPAACRALLNAPTADATVAEADGVLQPVFAVYMPSALGPLRAAPRDAALRAVLEGLRVTRVPLPADVVRSVDTPEDLTAAERELLQKRRSTPPRRAR